MVSQGHDDYSLTRVPLEGKQAVWKITMIRLGGLSCLPMLMLGAILGYSMSFKNAILAVILGSVILQVVGWAIGAIAAREGLSTSLITRWTGFGKFGSALIGLIFAITNFGWFGIQNSVFAEGLYKVTGIFNFTIWAIICGIGVTLIVIYGIKFMSITANIALPLFFIGLFWAFAKMLAGRDLGTLISEPAPGDTITMISAAVMVAGGFMLGAIVTADYSRFLKTNKQVFWMVLISTFVGELGMSIIGMLMARATKSSDVTTIIISLSGAIGLLLVVFSTLKINDLNLYGGSLGITNFFNLAFGVTWNRAMVTLVIGILGTILSVLGVLNYLTNYLILLGTYMPPVAAIIIVDYFILKRNRKMLDESRAANGSLPDKMEVWNPMALIAWIIGGLCGQFITWGICSVNALVAGGMAYFVLMKIYAATKGTSLFKMTEVKKEA